MKNVFFVLLLLPASGFASEKLNCLGDLEDGFEANACGAVPDPGTVSRVNCLGDLEDGYQGNLCSSVDKAEQLRLGKILR